MAVFCGYFLPGPGFSRRMRQENCRTRRGFTLIEMMVVISIIIVLSAASIPSILSISRRAAVSAAVTRVQSLLNESQRFAKRKTLVAQVLTAADHYGVVFVNDVSAPYVAMTYGTQITDEMLDEFGQPFSRVKIPASLELAWDGASTRLGWFFQYGTGKPILLPADQRPINIGTPAVAAKGLETSGGSSWSSKKLYNPAIPAIPVSPVSSFIHLRQRNGRIAMAVAQYSNGLIAISDVP